MLETELGASLPIGKFLQRPTALDLSKVILDRLETSDLDSPVVSGKQSESEPAITIGQEALWFVDQLAPGSPAYSLTMCISLRPKLDPELLDTAFRHVVARHDSLRLSFPAKNLRGQYRLPQHGPIPSGRP